MKRVAIVTSFPRAQRIEVYNQMARLNEVDFKVFYLRRMAYGRHWSYGPTIEHQHTFAKELRIRKHLYLNAGLLRPYYEYDPSLMVMTQYAAPAMQALMYLESFRGRPWVFWAETPHVRYAEDPIVKNHWLRARLRNLALWPIKQYAEEIWAVGERAVREYAEALHCEQPIRNLPYYSDLTRFFEVGKQRTPSDRVRFLFAGALTVRKGADLVAEAVRILLDQGFDFQIHVAGKGPFEGLFKNLTTNYPTRVYFEGFLQMDEVPTLHSKTDVLLFPSRHDGWGMTLPEGMASGMPVISTDQTGAAVDMLETSVNGIRIREANLDNVVQAMKSFIVNHGEIERMGRAARKTAQEYTHAIGARKFTSLLHSVLNNSIEGY